MMVVFPYTLQTTGATSKYKFGLFYQAAIISNHHGSYANQRNHRITLSN